VESTEECWARRNTADTGQITQHSDSYRLDVRGSIVGKGTAVSRLGTGGSFRRAKAAGT